MNAKESVLDVLMYLFEHYLDEDSDVDADRDSLEVDLVQAGFGETEVVKAFNWLESLASEAGIDIDAQPKHIAHPGMPAFVADFRHDSLGDESPTHGDLAADGAFLDAERAAADGWLVRDTEEAMRAAEESGEAIVMYSSPSLNTITGNAIGDSADPSLNPLGDALAGQRAASPVPSFPGAPIANAASRVYAAEEMERLGASCRGFLAFLEQAGVLDPATRERVIDRVMALETTDIDLEQLKWVLLMVLFNQPGRESMYAWMEDFVFDHGATVLH